MWVSEHTIDEAFLRIFQDEKVCEAGQSLLHEELRRRWRPTGFRRSDLDAALGRLEAEGCVRHGKSGGYEIVVLLEPGARRLRSFESLFDDLTHALGRLFFPRHPHGPVPPDIAPRRRRSDGA